MKFNVKDSDLLLVQWLADRIKMDVMEKYGIDIEVNSDESYLRGDLSIRSYRMQTQMK